MATSNQTYTHLPPKSVRRTKSRTFRLYQDQIDYIEKINGDCASLFLRYLLDSWIDNKVSDDVKQEFFTLRRDLRDKAQEAEALDKGVTNGSIRA